MSEDMTVQLLDELDAALADAQSDEIVATLESLREHYSATEISDRTAIERALLAGDSNPLSLEDRESITSFLTANGLTRTARARLLISGGLYTALPSSDSLSTLRTQVDNLMGLERDLETHHDAVWPLLSDITLPPRVKILDIELDTHRPVVDEVVQISLTISNLGDKPVDDVGIDCSNSSVEITPESRNGLRISGGDTSTVYFDGRPDIVGDARFEVQVQIGELVVDQQTIPIKVISRDDVLDEVVDSLTSSIEQLSTESSLSNGDRRSLRAHIENAQRSLWNAQQTMENDENAIQTISLLRVSIRHLTNSVRRATKIADSSDSDLLPGLIRVLTLQIEIVERLLSVLESE